MSNDLDRHRRVRALFEQVLDEPPDRRAAFLAAACATDSELQREVESLLSAEVQAGSFREQPAAAAPAGSSRPIGRRVGPYEVHSIIGVGGMGEVYRARDTRLDRDVALKVLPEIFAADPDRLARFGREARVLASLSHPHIGAIYGIEEDDGVRALVLELVDGPTLGDRIAQGPIPLDEVLAIARQIGQALAAAHEQGIIHRDLKPANVKLRTDGTVKVLDFGLARTVSPLSGIGTSSVSDPATATAITRAGLIVGTAAYMSPEQAKGQAVDKRTDIWAFGCVLFEMLTARRAFGGGEVSETLALVLTQEPDWRRLPPRTPPSLRRLLRRCLEKDRARRLADIADAQLELDERAPEAGENGPARPETARDRWVPWSLAAAGLLLALCLGVIVVRDRRAIDTEVYHSSILLPGRLGAPVIGTPAALSPNGRYLAFVAAETGGRDQLWLRSLDSAVARPVPETEGVRTPFWSPDGRWLAFVTPRGALRKVSASGGPAVTICESVLAGGAWSRDDVILFTESTSRSLARVRAAGGTPSAVTTIDVDAGEAAHLSPSFLPDGRRFVYAVVPNLGPANLGLSVGSLDSGARDRLPVEARFAQHAQGFLWFMRGNTLMAQPFEPGGARLVGEAVPVAEQLRTGPNGSVFSVSATGALVFQTDPSPRGSELTWFDRTGRPTATLGTVDDYSDPQLSPDGRRAVVSVGESGTSNRDLWVFDIARGVRTRLTSSPEPEMHSAWSPDGALIAFDAGRAGRFGMFQRRADGTGEVEALLTGEFDANPVAWSPDGRSILYVKRHAGTVNLWVLPLEGERKPFAFTRSKGNIPAQFSPDGRWVVFASSDSGRMEIYVAPFPGPGPRSLVSTGGGLDPRWVRDGREILYLDVPNGKLMSAAVTMRRDRVDVGDVKPLFDLPKVGTRGVFDVSADGQRILAMTRKDDSSSAPLTLVVNWPALLKK